MRPPIVPAVIVAAALCPAAIAADLPIISLLPGDLQPSSAAITRQKDGVVVQFAPADWPQVGFVLGKAYTQKDWSQAGGLSLALRNLNSTPLAVFVRLDDSSGHSSTGHLTLRPYERAAAVFPFQSSGKYGKYGGLPLSEAPDARALNVPDLNLDMGNIVRWQVFLNSPKAAQTVEIAAVALLPRRSFNGIVDRFGQYSRAAWPGKVNDEQELQAAAAQERAWNAAHPALADRDAWGGWKTGPTLTATGYFRAALVRDNREIASPSPNTPAPKGSRWWLVTPSGTLFWSAGLDCVDSSGSGPMQAAALYQWLPDDWKADGKTDWYRLNLARKFGPDAERKWLDNTLTRLPRWGFNTLGNWSEEDALQAHHVPYTAAIDLGGNLCDCFDPSFEAVAGKAIDGRTRERRTDPWCVGYFVDNELPWGGPPPALRVLAENSDSPSRRKLIGLLRRKYAVPEDWGKAWNITVTSWDDKPSLDKNNLSEAAQADCREFLVALAGRYYSVVSAQMKKYAPHQLYLGSRFAGCPREVVTVAAQYCDVVSFNVYEDTIDSLNYAGELGHPALIGEFQFGALDRGMFRGSFTPVCVKPDQAGRAQAYAAYVRSVLKNPAFVGAHWFQSVDEPLLGRGDGENFNIGFVSVTDTPYPELRAAARAIHAQIYPLARQAKF